MLIRFRIGAMPPYVSNSSDAKVSVREGSQVTLFCYENMGAPPPNITWLLVYYYVTKFLILLLHKINYRTKWK